MINCLKHSRLFGFVGKRKRGLTMYVVCKDHLELAIDMFVDEFEDAPDIVDLEEVHFTDWTPPAHCERCSAPGRFLVV